MGLDPEDRDVPCREEDRDKGQRAWQGLDSRWGCEWGWERAGSLSSSHSQLA